MAVDPFRAVLSCASLKYDFFPNLFHLQHNNMTKQHTKRDLKFMLYRMALGVVLFLTIFRNWDALKAFVGSWFN